jgi:hypothetical protein
LSPQAVESNAQRGVSVSLGDAGHNRFPSVRLQPLGHLSVFRINDLRVVRNRLSHTPVTVRASVRFPSYSALWRRPTPKYQMNCVRPPDVPRSVTGILVYPPNDQVARELPLGVRRQRARPVLQDQPVLTWTACSRHAHAHEQRAVRARLQMERAPLPTTCRPESPAAFEPGRSASRDHPGRPIGRCPAR